MSTRKRTRTMPILALLSALALVAAACGSDSEGDDAAATTAAPDTTAATTTTPPVDETTTTVAEVDELLETFDANGDGTITIGVAAAGPRDDNGYYQSLVNFAEEFSAANDFSPPIVSDEIGPAEAAQAISDLAQQGVDILMVGASEIAEPLPDLTEQFPDIFWYCNCGAGFQELQGLAQATDWGAAIHYTAGVAMGAVLQEQGSTQSVFLGCCDINFENEAYNATVAGLQSVDRKLHHGVRGNGRLPVRLRQFGQCHRGSDQRSGQRRNVGLCISGWSARPGRATCNR